MIRFFLFFFVLNTGLEGSQKLSALYNSLDPTSLVQHLSFYELYADTYEGKKALNDAWKILNQHAIGADISFKPAMITSLIGLLSKSSDSQEILVSREILPYLKKIGSKLANRKLQGFFATSEEEVKRLEPNQIDIARALFLTEFGDNPDLHRIESYEAILDLMALQIIGRLPPQAAPEKIIRVMNHLIFEELGFRFPPHSEFEKEIDAYTFLPSVIDSRKGVCLGVSLLYLCIAQRLGLPLEIITPPGHIFVRYREGETIINIETTARGVNYDSEVYLSIDVKALQARNPKEAIGLAHMNKAAMFWHNGDHYQTILAYHKAYPYLSSDPLLQEFMAYNYLFLGEEEIGKKILHQLKNYLPDYAVFKQTLIEDYLLGNVNPEGIQAVFSPCEENHEAYTRKKEHLEVIVQKYPKFRAGILSLANIWLKLHRMREALNWLNYYHEIEKNDPTAEYYLTLLNIERLNYPKAWEHLKQTEMILSEQNYYPKLLKQLRIALAMHAPD